VQLASGAQIFLGLLELFERDVDERHLLERRRLAQAVAGRAKFAALAAEPAELVAKRLIGAHCRKA
jgi:hypothetical protein